MNKYKELFPNFLLFEKNINHPAFLNELCSFELGEKLAMERIDPEYYYDKLCTAIHESGHIVALLMDPSNCEKIVEAKIECEMKRNSSNLDKIFYGWSGHVRFTGSFEDVVLSTVLNTAGINAGLALGINSLDAYSGSEEDMEIETKNILKNTKRIGGIDEACTWTYKKHDYKRLMKQEAVTLSLYSKAIMEENKNPIISFAAELYEKEILDTADIIRVASQISLNTDAFNSLRRYVKAFYA